jgi:iron complex outermembrane receptor protein
VPEEQFSLWGTYHFSERLAGLYASLGVRHVGESFGGRDQIKTPSYTLGDLMIGYELDSWDFALNARNVADKEFQATCLARGDCFPGEARTVVGRVRFQF